MGPKSPNPDQKIYGEDLNNFGPAVGFSWQVPWGGKADNSARRISLVSRGDADSFSDTAIGNPPGSSNQANYVIPLPDYFSLAKLSANQSLIPSSPDIPAVPDRDGDSRDGPNRTYECVRSGTM